MVDDYINVHYLFMSTNTYNNVIRNFIVRNMKIFDKKYITTPKTTCTYIVYLASIQRI